MSAETRTKLREIPGFKDLPEETIARIDSMSTELIVPPGQVLTKQGTPGREAFIIVDGTAAFSRDGDPQIFLPPGALVGELALLDGQPRAGNVVAVTQLRVLVVNPAEFASLSDDLGFTGWMRGQVQEHKPE
ncbi:MAG: family transcriptional regulator, cyclic receptor protein [Pseudonocardiales bacterium]|jgi:CRP-like cAMP-binding protein|nr:family transcriptional regulator, cyclic receptor protein [Pseudonocardiales bacterium]